jgi:hypothetical protein
MDVKKQVDDLQKLIADKQELYKVVLTGKNGFNTLREIRTEIKKLKSDLGLLVDYQNR